MWSVEVCVLRLAPLRPTFARIRDVNDRMRTCGSQSRGCRSDITTPLHDNSVGLRSQRTPMLPTPTRNYTSDPPCVNKDTAQNATTGLANLNSTRMRLLTSSATA
ncbi:hypothetical protein C2E23DRAFT_810917 [Lenzites betulinus]|nr:hypothetical protein C2E23DRAFT_810917 [Lenzites betulinus]